MKPIIVRGGGDVATGTIYTLCRAGFPVLVLETEYPSAIRRAVAFCEAAYEGRMQVEGMECILAKELKTAQELVRPGRPVLLIDPLGESIGKLHPHILVDAILAKKNLGTHRKMAQMTIGLGPGFTAGEDVDYVIETMRGHNLGRIITQGQALADTGIPAPVLGYGKERVIHAQSGGWFQGGLQIGDEVEEGQVIGYIEDEEERLPVHASLTGILRGVIRDGFPVTKGLKIADIDPRKEEKANCFTISDKARCIGGSVLQLAVSHLYDGHLKS